MIAPCAVCWSATVSGTPGLLPDVTSSTSPNALFDVLEVTGGPGICFGVMTRSTKAPAPTFCGVVSIVNGDPAPFSSANENVVAGPLFVSRTVRGAAVVPHGVKVKLTVDGDAVTEVATALPVIEMLLL